jgi:hypothetical protein
MMGTEMNEQQAFAADPQQKTYTGIQGSLKRKTERLPFTIKIVKTEEEMQKAVWIRHAAYARHLPDLAAKMVAPEALDYHPDVAVLLVESKLDGTPLGTVRIQTNDTAPLCIEQSVVLPSHLQGSRLAEVTRLGVESGRKGLLARLAIWKACFFYWEMRGVRWAIAAGRVPIDKQYLDLSFTDLYPDRGLIPLRHAGDVPHRVMAFESPTAYQRWYEQDHRLLDFICHVDHPDILLSNVALKQIPAHSPLAVSHRRAAFM